MGEAWLFCWGGKSVAGLKDWRDWGARVGNLIRGEVVEIQEHICGHHWSLQ